jgi:hypothetical protein
MAYRYIPNGKAWIKQWFKAKAVANGGVIRRNIDDVRKFASRKLLLAEVRRRGFHLIVCGGQYVVLCNRGQVKIVR